jgi:hypothetical protein
MICDWIVAWVGDAIFKIMMEGTKTQSFNILENNSSLDFWFLVPS